MRKRSYLLLLSISIFIALPTFAQEIVKPFRIGVILALSGDLANFGKYVQQGVELSLQHLSDKERSLIEIEWQDDQFKPAQSVSAYRSMMAKAPLDAVLYLGSSPGHALAPLTERDSVLSIGVGASDGSIVKDRKLSFLHWITPDDEAVAVVKELTRKGYRRVAIVAHEKEGPQAIVKAIVKHLDEGGVGMPRVVFEEALPVDSKDYRSLISKLRKTRPEVIFTLLFPGSVASFVRQVRDLGETADLCSVEAFEDKDEVLAAGDALKGAWYITGSTGSDEFIGMFLAKFGVEPAWAAANAFDAIQLIVEGVKAHGHDKEKIAQFLSNLKDYSGSLGVYSADGQNRFSLPPVVKTVGVK